MIWNDSLQTVLNDLTQEASEDLVQLWMLQKWVRRALPNLSPRAVRDATLAIVEKAVNGGEVVAGSFGENDFEIWPSQSDTMTRIEREWDDADRQLTLGDNVWFSHPNLGYRTLRLPTKE